MGTWVSGQRGEISQRLCAWAACVFQELFDRSPEVRDELFSAKPAELLATKLGEILAEVVRMLAIETPTELHGQLTEMSLRHIAYGLRDEHVEPFKDCLIHSLKDVIKMKGFKWNQRMKRAWSWSLTEITDLLMDGVNTGRPKVQNLQRQAKAPAPPAPGTTQPHLDVRITEARISSHLVSMIPFPAARGV